MTVINKMLQQFWRSITQSTQSLELSQYSLFSTFFFLSPPSPNRFQLGLGC